MYKQITYLILIFAGLLILSNKAFANDFALDTTFLSGSGLEGGQYPAVKVIKLLKDGRILVGSNCPTYNKMPYPTIVRLQSNGLVDTTFHTKTGAAGIVYDIGEQADGKIVLVGDFPTFDSQIANHIVRLNTNGSIDTTFKTGVGFSDNVYKIIIQKDQKIIVGGDFETYQKKQASAIIRLNPDGSRDTTFKMGYGFVNPSSSASYLSVKAMVEQTDGKIIIGGNFTYYQTYTCFNLVRINADGSLDSDAYYTDDEVYGLDIQPDGKCLVVGRFKRANSATKNGIARYNVNATLDAGFSSGVGLDVYPYSQNMPFGVKYLSINKIIITGGFDFVDNYNTINCCILDTNGAVNRSVTFGKSLPLIPTCLVEQEKGTLIFVGGFTEFDGIRANRIARLIYRSVNMENLPLKLCQNESYNLDYSISGQYAEDNVFSVQLSESNGSFLFPKILTTYKANKKGTILINIPNYLEPSSNYKIRLVSSNPKLYSEENKRTFTILQSPKAFFSGNEIVCKKSFASYFCEKQANTSYEWSAIGGNILDSINQNQVSVNWNNDSLGLIKLKTTNLLSLCESNYSKSIVIRNFDDLVINGSKNIVKNKEYTYYTDNKADYIYDWKVVGGDIIGDNNSNKIKILWGDFKTGTISLTATSLSVGCSVNTEYNIAISELPKKSFEVNSIYVDNSKAVLFVKYGVNERDPIMIDLFSILGKRIYSGEIIPDNFVQNEAHIDLSSISSGVYYLRIYNSNDEVFKAISLRK